MALTDWLRVCSLISITIPIFFALLFLFSNTTEAQVRTKKQAQLKDDYYQNTTFVRRIDVNRKKYTFYVNLTKKEKEMISLPSNNGAKKLKPLPEGTIMHLREDNKITLRFERPPPTPPAIGDIEINGKPHLFMEGSEGRFYYNRYGNKVDENGVILEPEKTLDSKPK